MANFNIPASPTNYEINISGFLGVDFSSSISDIDKRRSPNGFNFINRDGTIEKRNGYKSLAYLGQQANINGIWNVDTINGEYFIVHCGNKLFEMETDFSSYTELLTGLNNTISAGLIINSKLLILDGKRAIVYNLLENNNRVHYLDTIGYIPTTQISRNPNGTISQPYEEVNLVSDSRVNQFLGTETDTVYQLDDTNISTVTMVEVLNNQGAWQTKTVTTDYTVNLTNGTVTFTIAPGLSPVDGRDNVRITYTKVIASNKSQVNKCSILSAYGYAGANNRAFMTGNPDYANIITYSELEDITYIPAENIIKCGLEVVPLTGMIKLTNGNLAGLKDISDSDSTVFEIGYGTYNSKEQFPLLESTKGEGSISKNAQATLINDPLILTNNGIFALGTASLVDERYVYHRSYYIDAKLKQELNLQNAVAIVHDGKYYLAVNNHVYVADSRFKSNTNNSKTSNYQYEWYYWTGLPVRVWFVWNNRLYFGDKSGNICTFRENDDVNRFKDIDTIVTAEWNSAILDLSHRAYRKNIKRIAIQSNPTNSKLIIGYKLKGGIKEVLEKAYVNSTFPKTTIIKKKAKKLSFFSLYIENDENSNMNFNSVTVVYTVGTYYKGD